VCFREMGTMPRSFRASTRTFIAQRRRVAGKQHSQQMIEIMRLGYPQTKFFEEPLEILFGALLTVKAHAVM
jgi:hypothetical protein